MSVVCYIMSERQQREEFTPPLLKTILSLTTSHLLNVRNSRPISMSDLDTRGTATSTAPSLPKPALLQEKDIASRPAQCPTNPDQSCEIVPSTPSCSRWCSAPWKSRSGWTRWLADDIPVENAVPNLVMQAFATG